MKQSLAEMLGKLGIKVPSNGSLAGQRFAPGILVVSFTVPARPVPWKAAHTTRTGHAFKDKRLVAWQKTVQQYAAMAMAGMAPYSHAVEIRLEFHLAPIRGRTLPDLSNCVKSTEDALQGVVIENDRRVQRIVSQRFVSLVDEARIWVFATEET